MCLKDAGCFSGIHTAKLLYPLSVVKWQCPTGPASHRPQGHLPVSSGCRCCVTSGHCPGAHHLRVPIPRSERYPTYTSMPTVIRMPTQSMGQELRPGTFHGAPDVGWIPVCPPLGVSPHVSSLLGLGVFPREGAGVTATRVPKASAGWHACRA